MCIRDRAVLVDQLLRSAGFAKAVLHADTLDRYADALRKRLAYRAAQPTDDLMLLAGNNSAGFRGVPDDILTVKRLDGMHVDDAGRNAFGRELLRSPHRLMDKVTVCEEYHIAAVAYQTVFTEYKRSVLIRYDRDRFAAEADKACLLYTSTNENECYIF